MYGDKDISWERPGSVHDTGETPDETDHDLRHIRYAPGCETVGCGKLSVDR